MPCAVVVNSVRGGDPDYGLSDRSGHDRVDVESSAVLEIEVRNVRL